MKDSVLFAHRGMPGKLQNTRKGVRQALEKGYSGIEVDLVLSYDEVLVAAHDPWLDPEYFLGGSKDKLISQMSWSEIQLHTIDGDTPMDAGELFDIMASYPHVALYLDVKIEEEDKNLTASAEAVAKVLMRLIEQRAPQNALFIEAQSPRIADLYRAEKKNGYELFLSWPRYTAKDSGVLKTILKELAECIGVANAVEAVKQAGVAGYTAPHQIVQDSEMDAAQAAGVEIVVFGVDEVEEVNHFLRPGVHVIADHNENISPNA